MATTPKLWKGLTQVNTTDGGEVQDRGTIIGLNDGGYIIVWTDWGDAYNPIGAAIVGQRYNAFGNKVGGEVEISQFDSGSQFSPAVTRLSNGNIAVAFVDNFKADSVGVGQAIYVRIYNPSLGLIESYVPAVAAKLADPSITALADGGFAISYTKVNSADDTDIVARIVSSTGAMGAQFDVHNQTDNSDSSQTATLSNGNFVVVYEDEFNGSATDHDVLFRIFTPTGTAVLGPNPYYVVGGNSNGMEASPDVAALANGGFVVVWEDDDGPSGTNIRATIYNNAGGTVATDLLVQTATIGGQFSPNAVALNDGDFLVTWQSVENQEFTRAQRFDAAGNKIGTEFIVHQGDAVGLPEAALLADGRIAYAIGDHNLPSGDFDVDTAIWDPRTPADNFDGINQSDFLWQHDDGQAAVWLLNDTSVYWAGFVGPNIGPSWHLIGDGDFNADGRSDFLWQNDSGQAAVWGLNNGTTLQYGAAVGGNPGPSWHVIDTGDFNGDNKSDILWQGDDGTPSIWLMNGAQSTWIGAAGSFNPGPSWHIKGTGDFNGDGKSDILWQGDDGTPAIWLMNGAQSTWVGAVGSFNPGASWHIKDTGDFNGDGRSDILWQGDNGQAAIWLMNGTTVIGLGAAGFNPGASWHVVGSGQFNNGDANSDILWQSDNGQAAVYLMDGIGVIGSTGIGGIPGAEWHLIA
jgi:hypothetical protein